MTSIAAAAVRHPRIFAGRVKNYLRRLFRARDPFRNQFRESIPTHAPYHGQYGQDRIFHEELFGDLRGGVFVDVGAHDGLSFSNTAFFERELGWRGLCIEPIPEVFDSLAKNRGATCVQACVARNAGSRSFLRVSGYAEMLSGLADDYDPRHVQRIRDEVEKNGGSTMEISVNAVRLDALFRANRIEAIDLLCIDVEGAEIEALDSFDLATVRPTVVCIENNYLDPRIWRVLKAAGYRPYARIMQDEVWLSRGYSPTPLTGSFEAVPG